IRVAGMPRCEDERLQDHRRADERSPFSEFAPYACRSCERRRAAQRLLPKARLCSLSNRSERGNVRGEHIGIQKSVGRRPPAELFLSKKVENDLVSKEQCNQEIAGKRFPKNDFGSGNGTRPHFPELDVMRKGTPRQRFGGHERDRQQHREETESCAGSKQLTDGKSACGQGRGVSHPEKGPAVELFEAEHERNEQSARTG